MRDDPPGRLGPLLQPDYVQKLMQHATKQKLSDVHDSNSLCTYITFMTKAEMGQVAYEIGRMCRRSTTDLSGNGCWS